MTFYHQREQDNQGTKKSHKYHPVTVIMNTRSCQSFIILMQYYIQFVTVKFEWSGDWSTIWIEGLTVLSYKIAFLSLSIAFIFNLRDVPFNEFFLLI